LPKPNTCLVTSALNTYENENQNSTIVKPLYENENSKRIEQFQEEAESRARTYIKNLLENNQFSEDLGMAQEQEKVKDFWYTLNNSTPESAPPLNERYQSVSHEINVKILGVENLSDVD
jgi:hypothetical protein